MMTDYGHWTYSKRLLGEDFDPSPYFGFVYRITRRKTGRSYIGRKQMISIHRKKVAGRTNRKRVQKESKWRTYTGSCEELNKEIETLGKGEFDFEILKFCLNKRDLGYTETMYQFKEDVLDARFGDGTRKYYNSNIMNRWFVKENDET